MKQNKIKNNDTRIYFSQLLGMCDTISYSLSKFNYNVAKYVPYGPVKSVLPYLIRRAEENPLIGNQTSEEIQAYESDKKLLITIYAFIFFLFQGQIIHNIHQILEI